MTATPPPPVRDAVDTLADARSPSDLIAAHHQVVKAVRSSRRHAAATLGPLATAYLDAMALLDRQQADGVSFDERMRGFEAVIRGVWPQTRAWHVLCLACEDYGLMMRACPGDATCGRTRPHLAHDFGTPCHCAKGIRFREQAAPSPEDFQAAGKSKPTRLGRR